MGLFSNSNEHLFAYFEKSSIEKKFLNIFRFAKSKDIEFLSRYEDDDSNRYHNNFHTLAYDFLIFKKKVTFTARKVTIFSREKFEDRYNSFGSYLSTGKYYEGKLNKGDSSFIGLPQPDDDFFPYTILELESMFIDKKNKKKNFEKREYLNLINLANGWRKEVESGFHRLSDTIIKETIKHLK